MVTHNSERFFEAELYRLKARTLLLRGAPDAEVEGLFDPALLTARGQLARSLELRAATDLARLWMDHGKHAEALNVLSPVYGRFIEGFGTPDLREAEALLAELRRKLLRRHLPVPAQLLSWQSLEGTDPLGSRKHRVVMDELTPAYVAPEDAGL
jgi:predicted ATPase